MRIRLIIIIIIIIIHEFHGDTSLKQNKTSGPYKTSMLNTYNIYSAYTSTKTERVLWGKTAKRMMSYTRQWAV